MMWVKEGIEAQLRDSPKSFEVVVEQVSFGDGTLQPKVQYKVKARDVVPIGFPGITSAENRGLCTSARRPSKRQRGRSMILTVSELARLLGISGALAYRLGQERMMKLAFPKLLTL